MKLFDKFRQNKSLSCEEVLEVLQSYLDGETDTTTARHVSAHLAVCVDCEPESAVYSRIKTTLSLGGRDADPTILKRLEIFTHRISSGQTVASPELDR